MFFSDAGGQGCAAENDGVPVLCGLGRGSGTGGLFPAAVSFLARATETSLQKSLVGHSFFAHLPVIVRNVVFRHVCARTKRLFQRPPLGAVQGGLWHCTLFSGTGCCTCCTVRARKKRVQFQRSQARPLVRVYVGPVVNWRKPDGDCNAVHVNS